MDFVIRSRERQVGNFCFLHIYTIICFSLIWKIQLYHALYKYPEECHPYIWASDNPNETAVYLKCQQQYVNQFTNYTIIQTEETLGFQMQCLQEITSTMLPQSLKHLRFLKDLRFDSCLLQNLPEGMLDGLTDLEGFTVTNPSIEFGTVPPKIMVISPNLFKPTPNLQIIDFSFTALKEMPSDVLCPITGLQSLNVASNKLNTLENFCWDFNTSCCIQLQLLNMSSNNIDHLPFQTLFPMTHMLILDFKNNNINLIEERCLQQMPNLLLFDISFNKLSNIPPDIFNFSTKLIKILLNNNQLEYLPSTLFRGLRELEILNLGWNKINDINPNSFDDLHELLLLDLSNNPLQNLPGEIFKSTSKLQILGIENSQLLNLQPSHFQYLTSLFALDISGNMFSNFTNEHFKSLILLKILDLSKNSLKSTPDTSSFKKLEFLDLNSNAIEKITSSFRNNSVLTILNLANNLISDLNKEHFTNFTNMQELILSNNHLTSIKVLNACCKSLVFLSVDRNKINIFDRTLSSLQSLKVANLSYNHLSGEVDFSSVLPERLETLDISHNYINKLANRLKKTLYLTSLNASYNKIEVISANDLPASLVTIDLCCNLIKKLGPNTFASMSKLQYVNLSNNNFTVLMNNWFFFKNPFPNNLNLPTIDLFNNNIICNCFNEWILNRIKYSSDRWYPHLNFPEYCEVEHVRMRSFGVIRWLNKIKPELFFCSYEQLSKDCPRLCNCYTDNRRSISQIDCGGYQNSWDFQSFPEDPNVTHLFLDDVREVPWRLIKNLTRLSALFLNCSGITELKPNGFASLSNLEELHLEDNNLTEISSQDFSGLLKLRWLYLQNNKLFNIDSSAFSPLRSLEYLNLESNTLKSVHLINISHGLQKVALAYNPFECTCEFILPLKKWITEHQTQIENLNNTFCIKEDGIESEFLAFNDTVCFASEAQTIRSGMNIAILSLLIIASCCLVIGICLAILYYFRHEILVWLYTRYSIRLFHHNLDEKQDKVYDAFISYSNEDEAFVANELVPHLEPYKLCLHQRDFLVGSYITDSIVQAVQTSCRTIFVVSPYFVRSEWCNFEFKTAHHQALHDRCCRLIVIILQDVPLKDMDKELRLYMRTNTYLRYDDSNFWNKLIYALPTPTTVL